MIHLEIPRNKRSKKTWLVGLFQNRKPGEPCYGFSSGAQTRTEDLWVMSPTSCHCSTPQYLQLALYADSQFRQITASVVAHLPRGY